MVGSPFNELIQNKIFSGGNYDKFEPGFIDHNENIPEPEAYVLNWSKTPFTSHVEIYRKSTAPAETGSWKEISS